MNKNCLILFNEEKEIWLYIPIGKCFFIIIPIFMELHMNMQNRIYKHFVPHNFSIFGHFFRKIAFLENKRLLQF